jgi:molecular chaperone GrpE
MNNEVNNQSKVQEEQESGELSKPTSSTTTTNSGVSGEVVDFPKPPASVSVEELEKIKSRAAQADEFWDRLLRQTAEFDNYRKRMARDRQEAVQFANQALLQNLVTVLDHFEAAINAANQAKESSLESFKSGMNLIHSQLKSVLTETGLEEINAQNQTFNPSWHEAVSQKETAEAPEGQVVEQLRKGYKLRERLLRPAMVVVAKAPSA